MAGYHCLMPNSIIFANGLLSDAFGMMPLASFFRYWAFPMLFSYTMYILLSELLSNNIRILTQKNGGYWSRNGRLVEKTPIFDVFRKALSDRRLHGY